MAGKEDFTEMLRTLNLEGCIDSFQVDKNAGREAQLSITVRKPVYETTVVSLESKVGSGE